MSPVPDTNSKVEMLQEETLTNNIDRLFGQWDKLDSPGISVCAAKDGKIIYNKGFGSANLEYDVPITPATVFHVASVSKQFTAMSIALLAGEGKLSFDDDIRKYLPEIHDFGKVITIRHLLNHTSGLRDQWELLEIGGYRLDDVITQEHILNLLANQRELNFAPGEEFMYCNSGYTLLAEIAGRVSGKTFTQFTEERIFKPLEMSNTHFHIDNEMIVKNMAYSYYPDGKGGFKKSTLNFANVGATSLFTTAEDLVKWLMNFESFKVGDEWVLNSMKKACVLNNGTVIPYGFGIGMMEYKGMKTFGHGGVDAGYRSNVSFIPEQRFCVVVLSNLAAVEPFGLCNQITDICLSAEIAKYEIKMEKAEKEEPAAPPQQNEERKQEYQPEGDFEEYKGKYFSNELETVYSFDIKNERPVMKHLRFREIVLLPKDKDLFSLEGMGPIKIRFIRDEDNKVSGFKYMGYRARDIHFSRVDM